MDDTNLIRRLTSLGLNGYEARAYVALTERGGCTAAEVARISGLPRQRIYDVLASLVEKGLASTRPGTVLKYVATEPAQAMEGLVAARRQQLADLEGQASAISETLSPLYQAGQRHTDPMQYIEILRDRRAINARFDELQAAVQREILVFNKPPYAKRPQENTEGLRVARTKTARGIYELSLFDDLAATEGVRRFCQAGEEVRVVPELPLKLVIIDESIVMFGMVDPVAESSDLTIMVVQHPALAQVLKTAFAAYWAQGVSFDDAYRDSMHRRMAVGS
jgi:sugar-specific transcriptional regulator TrmB